MLLGVAIIGIIEDLVSLVIIAIGLTWVTAGLLAIALSLTSGELESLTTVTTESLRWLQNREHAADERRALYEKLFFEGPAGRRLSRFLLLMGSATAIPTTGVFADTTAVVLGALSSVDEATRQAFEPLLANQESLLHDDDIEDVGEALEPGSSVAMILFEHTWASEFRRALVGAGGELIDSLRIAPETIEAARVALAEGGD